MAFEDLKIAPVLWFSVSVFYYQIHNILQCKQRYKSQMIIKIFTSRTKNYGDYGL